MLPKNPRPLVICGPSGSGKSTLLKRLFDDFPDTFGFSVSHTTRNPRPGEEHGKHYYFIEKEDMKSRVDQGEFIEHATFSNNMYGTSKRAVEDVQCAGKVCVLDIDVQGVKQIKQSTFDPMYVFIKPPSVTELKRRLVNRKTESEESLNARLAAAEIELKYGDEPGNFHCVIVNDDVEKAYETLRKFITNELKKQSQTDEQESRST